MGDQDTAAPEPPVVTATVEAPATAAPPAPPATDDNDERLGPEGVKALTEFKKRAREAEAELARLREQSMSDAEKAVERARREADDKARREITAEWQRRFIRAEVKAAAVEKLRDPEDAFRYLDLDSFTVDDDGNVDTRAINKAIDKLVTERDYLKRAKFAGAADGGARPPAAPTETAPGLPRLTAAYREATSR